jgi:uncharacterized protein (TIRG00374 family)
MRKLTKEKRNSLLNIGFILVTLLLVLYLVTRAGDAGQILAAFRAISPWWLMGALACFALHIVLEGLGLYLFFFFQKVRISWKSCNLIGLVGIYYSNITPAATGGQPMQAFSLKKRGVPTGIGYSALAVKYFCWQCALLLVGAAAWINSAARVHALLGQAVWLIALGFFVNSLMVSLIILLSINRNLVRAIIIFLVNLASRLRLVKDRAQASSRLDAALNDFHSSVEILTRHPMQFLVLFAVALAQVTALMSIIYFIYRGLALTEGSYLQVLTIQVLLYITASFTPLPGASGAQEGGFYLFFRTIFPHSLVFAGLLLWRFVTYYLFIIVGFFAVIADQTYSSRKRKRMILEEELAAAGKAAEPESGQP